MKQTLMPMTIKELRELIQGCDDDARVIAKTLKWGNKSESTGWVAAQKCKTMFGQDGIEIIIDDRILDD